MNNKNYISINIPYYVLKEMLGNFILAIILKIMQNMKHFLVN